MEENILITYLNSWKWNKANYCKISWKKYFKPLMLVEMELYQN